MGDRAPEKRKLQVCPTSGPFLQIHQLFMKYGNKKQFVSSLAHHSHAYSALVIIKVTL